MQDADEAGFAEYAAARLAALRRLGYLLCGDWHLAEDAVSVVLGKLYVHWPAANRASSLDAYVRRMLVRAIVDERRRPWRRESPAAYPVPGAQDGAADQVHDRVVLRDVLSRMPTRRRAVLVLRFYEGLTVEETAAAMGCTTGTPKGR